MQRHHPQLPAVLRFRQPLKHVPNALELRTRDMSSVVPKKIVQRLLNRLLCLLPFRSSRCRGQVVPNFPQGLRNGRVDVGPIA